LRSLIDQNLLIELLINLLDRSKVRSSGLCCYIQISEVCWSLYLHQRVHPFFFQR